MRRRSRHRSFDVELPREFLVGEATARGTGSGHRETVGIGHLARVESQHSLAQVAVKVKRLRRCDGYRRSRA